MSYYVMLVTFFRERRRVAAMIWRRACGIDWASAWIQGQHPMKSLIYKIRVSDSAA